MTEQRVFTPADRFVDAQLWWAASELCRRHSQLGIIETVFTDWGALIEAVGEVDGTAVRVGFSRVAGIVIQDRDFQVTPIELLEQSNPHAVLRRIECEVGIGKPADTPPTNEDTIAYRAIAWILNAMLNSRHSWTVRGERANDPSVGESVGWMGTASEWPSVVSLRQRWAELDAAGELYSSVPVAQAWVLLRDLEPVAVFDRHGTVHTLRGPAGLLTAYRASRHVLGSAVAEVLGPLLRM